MTESKCVLEIRVDGNRRMVGPVHSLTLAKVLARRMRNENPEAKIRVHMLHEPAMASKEATPPHIHPDQTTVDEQIKHAEDYVDPTTVG